LESQIAFVHSKLWGPLLPFPPKTTASPIALFAAPRFVVRSRLELRAVILAVRPQLAAPSPAEIVVVKR
jgi:hypothetical protein